MFYKKNSTCPGQFSTRQLKMRICEWANVSFPHCKWEFETTTHTPYLTPKGSYGVSFVIIFEENDCIIIAPHYIQLCFVREIQYIAG